MVTSGHSANQAANLIQAHSGQQLHVSGVFIVLLELALVLENLLPILVVVTWLPAPAREVSDRLVTAFSVTCILSALVPTPLGLASYFSGGWYGGAPTCTVYQLTSTWCNLFSLALLTYICVNCQVAVGHLIKVKSAGPCQPCQRSTQAVSSQQAHGDSLHTLSNRPSPTLLSPQRSVSVQHVPSSTSPPHCDASADDKFLSPNNDTCCNNNKSYNVAVTYKAESFQIDVAESKANYDRTVLSPKQHIELSTPIIQAVDVTQSKSKIVKEMVMVPDVAQSVIQLDNERSLSFEEDSRLQYSELNPNPYHASHVQACHNHANTKRNDQSARYQADFLLCEQSQDIKLYSPAINRNIETCTKAMKDVKCTQITSPMTFERHESDLKHPASCSSTNNTQKERSFRDGGCLCQQQYQSRDFVSVMLLLLFTCTLAISALPVVGFGPHSTHTETSCRSWLVPLPLLARERTFFVVYLFFVYTCLILGCSSGISVCLKVSKRMKQERKRKSRLYHEEENVPDVVGLFTLNDMKRHYSLTCVVMAGLLTWLPIVTMLTLQKAGLQVSEATIMYSSIATSLPGLLNPLLYSLALTRYRIGYKAVMEKCCCKSRANRSQHLRGTQSTTNTSDVGINADTVLNSTSDGHTCLHGRVNPNFNSLLDVSIDDTYDENDEDYFPDDSELTEDDLIQQQSKPSEKTPLQALTTSSPSAGALRTLLTNRTKEQWQRQQDDSSSSSSDSERLLVSRSHYSDEETGL